MHDNSYVQRSDRPDLHFLTQFSDSTLPLIFVLVRASVFSLHGVSLPFSVSSAWSLQTSVCDQHTISSADRECE